MQKIVIFKLLLKPSFARSFGHLGFFSRSNSLNANRHLVKSSFARFYCIAFKIRRLVVLLPFSVQDLLVPRWKALMCSFLDLGGQGHGSAFRVCHALLKMAILLGKMSKSRVSLQGTV